MKKRPGFKITSFFLVIVIILGIFSGCKTDNTSTAGKTSAIPAEQTQVFIDDNNRANLVNHGFIYEETNYIYYKNYQDQCALYRLDKKTGEKLKLADAYNSVGEGNTRPKLMMISGITDDIVYFTTSDQERNTAEPNHDYVALYSVGKDGKSVKKLFTVSESCIINNGYAYYVALSSDSVNESNYYRYNLDNGNTEILIKNYNGMYEVFDGANNKMYYEAQDEKNVLSIYEFDLNLMFEKIILKSDDQGSNNVSEAKFLNYYRNSLYYCENKSIKKYDILNNVIETVSSIPTDKLGSILSLVVSHLGVYFIAGKSRSLYNAESLIPTEIMILEGSLNSPGLALADKYIFISNNRQGGINDYIKAYTLKGAESNIGL